MPQIFHRSTNTLSRATIFGAVFVIAAKKKEKDSCLEK